MQLPSMKPKFEFMPEITSRQLRSFVVIVMVIIMAVSVIIIVRDLAATIQRSSDLQACRSAKATEVADAKADLDVAVSDGLEAVGVKDQERFNDIVSELPELRQEYLQAVKDYQGAVQRSIDDPDGFLADCSTSSP